MPGLTTGQAITQPIDNLPQEPLILPGVAALGLLVQAVNHVLGDQIHRVSASHRALLVCPNWAFGLVG
jgi:hypothetical protein